MYVVWRALLQSYISLFAQRCMLPVLQIPPFSLFYLPRLVRLQMIKKRIESLIDRDYLERDGTDSNTYRYVA